MTDSASSSRKAAWRESEFWALCEFLLDRYDEMEHPATMELVATQRALVSRMMVRQAAAPVTADALEVVVDLLTSLAQPYVAHREFRPSWLLGDVPRLPRQRGGDEPAPSRRASRNRGHPRRGTEPTP